MIGTHQDKDFDENKIPYEEFYSHHRFTETTDEDSVNVHEVVPRFGWGFDMVDELKPNSLLDLGTLDGSFPLTIRKHFGIAVAGVDLTKDGIALAKKRAAGFPHIEFYQNSIEDQLEEFIALERKFDMITCFEVIEHVKDPARLIKLIDGVLSPNGNVLFSTPDFESPMYGKDDEVNKCHVRLYTTADKDYEAVNKYGNVRKATSIVEEIGKDRIKSIGVYSHLINVRYQ